MYTQNIDQCVQDIKCRFKIPTILIKVWSAFRITGKIINSYRWF